jgi:NADPH:quinone reductase-like Zn-dependent oxidoreductase
MHAVQVHHFGAPEVLRYDEVARPEPGPGEVLIQVEAAGINPPELYARIGFTNFPEEQRPKDWFLPYVPGSDVSGIVAALGPGVTEFHETEEVFGPVRFPEAKPGGQTYAEYSTAPAADLAHKPSSIDHVHAAGVPMAGLTAYQYVFDHIGLEDGKTVLVNGAGGRRRPLRRATGEDKGGACDRSGVRTA